MAMENVDNFNVTCDEVSLKSQILGDFQLVWIPTNVYGLYNQRSFRWKSASTLTSIRTLSDDLPKGNLDNIYTNVIKQWLPLYNKWWSHHIACYVMKTHCVLRSVDPLTSSLAICISLCWEYFINPDAKTSWVLSSLDTTPCTNKTICQMHCKSFPRNSLRRHIIMWGLLFIIARAVNIIS